MKKYRKTYGINGMLEWHGIVESHGVKMKVSFTNGSVSAFGAAPATFTTSKPITQHIIENSEQFKGGRIFIYQSVELPGEEQPKRSVKAAVEANDAEPSAEKTVVEVSSLTEAKEYLMENFSIGSSKLRNRAAIMEQAEANGIEFVGL